MEMSDASLAAYLDSLCHACEAEPAVRGHHLCAECYRPSRLAQICVNCNGCIAEGVCTSCDMPSEDATYEQLTAWEERRAPSKGDATALQTLTPYAANIESECSICIDTCVVGSKVITLHCVHTFHVECISQWVSSYSLECPVCKTPARQA